jgi:uncharacterized repeat protein (TIGR03987 family)
MPRKPRPVGVKTGDVYKSINCTPHLDDLLRLQPARSAVRKPARNTIKELSMIAGMTIITMALVFYSIGVWSERFAGRLKPWHLVFFWLGLVFDTLGTGMMFERAGGMVFDVHGISGLLAIILMLIHAVWATIVLLRKDECWITSFHTFSVAVWIIWLIPYFSPMFFQLRVNA